ncbi:hypothetical protein Tco_0899520 [Tanacetum coccineum]
MYDTKGVKVRKGIMQTKTELNWNKPNKVLVMKSRNTKLLSSIEDSHHGPSNAMHNPPQPLKIHIKMDMELVIRKCNRLLTPNVERLFKVILKDAAQIKAAKKPAKKSASAQPTNSSQPIHTTSIGIGARKATGKGLGDAIVQTTNEQAESAHILQSCT